MANTLPASVGFRLVPGNFAPMKGADRHGRAREDQCGHAMEMWLKLDEDLVLAASYVTDGCASFVRAGSWVAHLAQGKPLEAVLALEPAEVLAALGEDDREARDCVDLALRALKAAAGAGVKA